MLRACIVALAIPGLIAACGETTSPGGATPPAGGNGSTSSPQASQEVNPGGDIPDTQTYVAYAFPSGAFTVNVPEGWARTDSGGTVMFISQFNSVALMTVPATAQPTTGSASAGEVPAIQHQSSHVVIGNASATTRPAGQVILITYQADSPPNPVTGHIARLDVERYEFWRSGVEAVITLAAPVGADNVDPWRTITESFTWH
jgi:hypothetical protein